RYAAELHRNSRELAGEERARQLQLAYARVRSALAVAEQAVQDDLRDLRYVSSVLGCRGTLGAFLLADGDRAGAREQAVLALDLFERHRALVQEPVADGLVEGQPARPQPPPSGGPGRADRPPRGDEPPRGDGPRAGRRPGDRRRPIEGIDWEAWGALGDLLRRLDDRELRERLRQLVFGR
ncbi:MAG: hypothetical protein KAI24_25355, partial [Planctomycetes bacterium]|nr:hypothetical protein [Planctomycetota bacterium]